MADPVIAGTQPEYVVVKPGTYLWCACGRSAEQPFCDGTHQGSDFSPVSVEFSETLYAAFCMCKRTGRPPYCDGTHARM